MTDSASSSDTTYRQSLHQALYASRVLTGALDDELGIQKNTKTTKLGVQHQEENQAALNATLSERLKQAVAACDDLSSFETDPNPQTATGDLALHLLLLIHTYLIEKKKDVDSRVAVQDERLPPSLKRQGVQPKEDVGLGVKDVKLITTLQSLAFKWALSTRIRAYDDTLFSLAPKGFSRAQDKHGSTKLTPHNRFEEIDEDAEVQDRARARQAFDTARKDLYGVVDKWMAVVAAHSPTTSKASVNTTTDVVTVMLRVGIVDYLSSLLRLGFGPSVTSNASAASQASSTTTKDAIQKRTAAATTQLLRFLSTHSAMSALSSVIAHSAAKRGAPSFVKAVSSRLLSAQLLRPDGVRSLFIITFGGADAAEAAVELEGQSQETGTAAPGTNSLKRFEQCARLLLTPPQGMPAEVYLPIILPNLLDVLAPDLSASSNITPPPQEQMRAAGFVLTRISERHPTSFYDAMHDRVYSKFFPSTETAREAYTVGASANAESDSIVAVSPEQLDRAISTLSSFLLFSEPSPTFLTTLFEPILPQLLTLHDHLQVPKQAVGKGKVRSVESAGQTDRLKAEISNFLRTWARLVDAKHGAGSLLRSIKSAEKGIGCEQPAPHDEGLSFFWSSEPNGMSIRFGTDPSMEGQDLSTLLKDLSLATLADQLKTGKDDELDLTKIAPDLSAKLGLRPDPRLVATLLKTAERKDVARDLLPAVLNVYMAQKSSAKAGVSGEDKVSSLGTQSVLYLQLILHLLDAFGSDLLQGDVPATLAFIDFSLSSPSQRQAMPQQGQASAASEEAAGDDMPFISAKSSTTKSSVSSLFNVAAESPTVPLVDKAADNESVDAEEGVEEDDEELVSTALSLLLSLLETDTSLSSETHPMLLVIADKIEHHLDSSSSEIRSLAKEAKLVLLARRSSIRGHAPNTSTATNETSSKALAYAQAQETYQEALKLLQDPILPVRAHGLVLLRRLVSDDTKNGGQHVDRVDPALVPAILDIFLHAVQDEESYLYLNAVQGLAALASSGGGQTISRLVGVYIGRDDGLVSQGLGGREVEKRLRVGEALSQVIQRCADSMAAHVDAVVPPLLARLRDRALPNVLRSSFVSILGTMIEAVPRTMVVKGYATQLAQVCIDIVVIEMVKRPDVGKEGAVKLNVANKRVKDVDDEEKGKKAEEEQRRLDSATNADAKIAHLRRAAMLLLTLLVRGTRMQLENSGEDGGVVEKLSSLRLPGGGVLPNVSAPGDDLSGRDGRSLKGKDLLFPPELLGRLKQVAGYVQAGDTDAVVRTHAHDCLEHVEALELDLLQSALISR
ncbi:Protein required for cell viability [Pseudozyma hubeiensis]|nr:Protein required for cell viability [Pseudozyma hubeiensis]